MSLLQMQLRCRKYDVDSPMANAIGDIIKKEMSYGRVLWQTCRTFFEMVPKAIRHLGALHPTASSMNVVVN